MKFIDEAEIYIKAGDGGSGCVSFRREKYVPRGGPDGGDGGKGGNVVIRASQMHHTLLDLKYKPRHIARRGGHGMGSLKTGASSPNLVIVVPVGTLVKDADTNEILADLTADGQECIAARGGIGGKGNAHFKTSTHQTPRFSQPGMPGEERRIRLELKLIADVGLVGFPNVGKSTFIAKVSAARPKIADYPFTTLMPNLGVVAYGSYRTFVVADIPGLIEGAHQGAGMGTRFLRHIERTRVLLHIIDIADDSSLTGWEKYTLINRELSSFGPSIMGKPQIVAINKIDLTETREKLKKEIDFFAQKGIEIFAFSAVTGEGIPRIIDAIVAILNTSTMDETCQTSTSKS
ncbi:MAG: GTPase ObgE [Syntrophaceae bacterium]|nr:GTPase ObgE [Syntrophaceae bacterium]